MPSHRAARAAAVLLAEDRRGLLAHLEADPARRPRVLYELGGGGDGPAACVPTAGPVQARAKLLDHQPVTVTVVESLCSWARSTPKALTARTTTGVRSVARSASNSRSSARPT